MENNFLPQEYKDKMEKELSTIDKDCLSCVLESVEGVAFYIGVKIVQAKPMTREDYHKLTRNRGEVQNAAMIVVHEGNYLDEGYLVQYTQTDPSKPPYFSWCPKAEFEAVNRLINGFTFGEAIEAAKKGYKIARRKWNGKNMFVVYMPPLQLPPHSSQEPGAKVNDRTAKFIGEDTPLDCQPYFAMFNAQKQWIPGWLASQSDMLDDDWYIVE